MYIAIDNSIKNSPLQIITAVHSPNEEYIKYSHSPLIKTNSQIENLPYDISFMHTVLFETSFSIIGKENCLAITTCKLIESLSHQNGSEIEKILLNEKINLETKKLITKILQNKFKLKPKLQQKTKANLSYPLSNIAQNLTQELYQYYKTNNEQYSTKKSKKNKKEQKQHKNKYLEYLITPKIERYIDFI